MMTTSRGAGLALGALAALVGAVNTNAQSMPTSIGHAPDILISALPRARGMLLVTSPSFTAGGDVPRASTQYGENRFPGLRWSAGPAGTRSYVVVLQGELGSSHAAGTSVHLVLYNLPASTTSLPVGLETAPAGAAYGTNVHGAGAPYAGPHTHDASSHRYHAQVFALDHTLASNDAADLDALKRSIRGHVLAAGDLIGYAAKPLDVSGDNAPVRIETGLVSGVPARKPGVTVYKGIPYAAPPVGPLRWRAPAAPAAWAGVRRADGFGAACPQPGGEMARGLPQSEDCLTLNIWTGAKPGSVEKRPVYVWIYGGGFIGGTGASPEFDGEALARKGVLVVTFNYRVGVLGFLATPELSRESGHAASGNYGLLDDIAALRWVQRNIAAFGGDPAKVTIGGQSAGAGAVGFLAMSPLAKGLFRAGIAESHARDPRDTELRYLSVSWRPLATAEQAGTRYAAAHGAGTLDALRAMPWQRLIEGSNTIDASVETGSSGKPPLFRPVVDGWVIPDGYAQTYAKRTQNRVTFVAGNNRDETGAVPETAFDTLRAQTTPPRAGMPQTSVTLAAYLAAARRKFGTLTADFLKLYPARDDQDAALQNNAAARDNSRVSTWLWGRQWTRGVDKPVFTYFWDHAPPGPSHDLRGAYHGSEIYYAFDSLDAVDRPWAAEDRRIADVMSSYWVNIIKDGNPNGPGLPTWPRYDPTLPRVMELGDRFGMIPVADPAKIAFWQRFFATKKAW
ncbi:carboxylesterase family protein [Sphingomonas sp. OK281]|uniref:carboxylesterase family protein n=1 Tax=Sphingomonas sp. OK281 TaxID=1881067 RepID=UPI0008ECEE89|nr:carboxylesterase family protein [Sphingomonas sp. OK281]SFO33815.1 para-nitrobenzyl esterase [Sphingomonas sp. OK281]